jgi:N-acetylglucosamine-6-phosphate deacetylase
MVFAFVNGRVVTGNSIVSGKAVIVDGSEVREIADAAPNDADLVDLQGGLLLPGFIDVQVNGGGGVLFNSEPTVEGLRAIGKAHARFGTTGFLPTVVSGDLPTIKKAIAAVDEAIADGIPGVLGIHIEGPFISPARGGIHDRTNFRAMTADAVSVLTSLKRGRTLVTLAPEIVEPQVIATLVQAGVIVCAGHTDASYDETQRALKAGMRGFTHLFNAMSPLISRHPGAVGAALDDHESWCGIIADGRHVHPAAVRVAFRCKGAAKLMLVTDAMPPVGSDQTIFTLQGKSIRVEDGVCRGPDGTLAGAAVGMDVIFRNASSFLDIDPATASRLASSNAATFLRLDDRGHIEAGARADFVLLNDALDVRQTWIGGKPQVP